MLSLRNCGERPKGSTMAKTNLLIASLLLRKLDQGNHTRGGRDKK
jgi:hypothetical protein